MKLEQESIIDNLENDSQFYKKANIIIPVARSSALYQVIKTTPCFLLISDTDFHRRLLASKTTGAKLETGFEPVSPLKVGSLLSC